MSLLEQLQTMTDDKKDPDESASQLSSPAARGRVEPHAVKITSVNISIGDFVVLFIKMAIASIPAGIIIFIIYMICSAIFGGLLVGGSRLFMR